MIIRISERSSEPIYLQIAAQLRRQVADGTVRSGETLPPVRELAASLDVNMHTVRAAFSILRDEGLIDMRRGRGITVLKAARDTATIVELARSLVSEARRMGLSDSDIQHAVEAQL